MFLPEREAPLLGSPVRWKMVDPVGKNVPALGAVDSRLLGEWLLELLLQYRLPPQTRTVLFRKQIDSPVPLLQAVVLSPVQQGGVDDSDPDRFPVPAATSR